jgi:hypothetical protein
MFRIFLCAASLLLSALAPAATEAAEAPPRNAPLGILYCFNRYTSEFLNWGMCADYQFPCRPHRITWRHPNYFMPHDCSPEDERHAFH